MANKKENHQPKKSKKYLSQTDVPNYSLDESIRIPKAIADNYASGPATPLQVAAALNIAPTSSHFRQICGAAIAYGLTKGGYNAPEISLESLGKRITCQLEEGDDLNAKREALLKPRVIGEFINKYNNSPLPRQDIAINVLIDMGVPRERAKNVFELILSSAESVGLIRTIQNKKYIDLSGIPKSESEDDEEPETSEESKDGKSQTTIENSAQDEQPPQPPSTNNKKVFITHGKNKEFVEPIKKLLSFGELEAVVSVEKQSVSKPVPEKVMSDMRGCGAAIIHVEAEQKLTDADGKEVVMLNPNVLIEIGAAMALFSKRFILLIKEGVKLPSNLQGLYEVRYQNDTLDGDATIRLLEAINELKKIK